LQDCGNFYSIEWYRDTTVGVVHDNSVNFHDDEDESSHRQLPATSRARRSPGLDPFQPRVKRQMASGSPETYDPLLVPML
jgi:hypothetical protein